MGSVEAERFPDGLLHVWKGAPVHGAADSLATKPHATGEPRDRTLASRTPDKGLHDPQSESFGLFSSTHPGYELS